MKHLFKILSLCTLYLILSTGISAQNVVITDDNTYTPTSNNALLEVKPGSNDKGVLIPRLTTAERTAITMSAAADKGLLVYDTDTKSFWYYDGTAWVEIGATSSGMSDTDNDTKIQVEESADEDRIRFDVAGTEALVIDENGNVGIGTDSPAKDLHILSYGDVSIFLEADSDNSGEGDQPELIFSQDGGAVKTYLGYFNQQNAFSINQTYNEDIQFFTDNTFRMAIKGDGKVQVGEYYLPATDGTNGQQLTTDGIGNVSWSASGIWSENGGNVYRSGGNVGIGTDNPQSMLHVYRVGGAENETIDQQQTDATSGTFLSTSFWQSFTAGSSGILSKIELVDGRTSNGTFIMTIYQGEGTGGALLGQSYPVQLDNGGFEFIPFHFSSSISVISGQQYTFKIETSGSTWAVRYANSNPYSGGRYSGLSSRDLSFKTYVGTAYIPRVIFKVMDDGNIQIGDYILPDTDGTSGQQLTTDGSGNVSWSSSGGLWSESSGNIYRNSGNVGIGTNSIPSESRLVVGALDATEGGQIQLNSPGGSYSTAYFFDVYQNNLRLLKGSNSGSGSQILGVDNNGRVGIGVANPSCPLEVYGNSALTSNYGWFNSDGNSGTSSGTHAYSIKASDRIMASEFNAVSDQRIKTNLTGSDISTDLEKVKQLRLTRYNYIDSISKDRKQQKGFIAQEVEKVLPEAVNISSGFVPDIFVLATNIETKEEKTIVEIPKEHNLQHGDMLRMITPAGQLEAEVLEIISARSFAVKLNSSPESIFVYGKKVDDFRAVNYDYIFSTGIGAIQELSKQVEELKSLQAEVEELKAMLGGSLQSAVDSR